MKRRRRFFRRRRSSLYRHRNSVNLTTVSKQLILNPLSPTCIKSNDMKFSDVEFTLPGFLQFDSNIRAIRVSLLQATIPVSFYFINETNNGFSFLLKAGNQEEVPFSFGAPLGSYDVRQYIEYFNLWKQEQELYYELNSDLVDALQSMRLHFNETTSTFILHKRLQDIITIETTKSTARDILGLNDLSNEDITLDSTIASYAFPALVDLLGPYYILISSDAFPIRHTDTRSQKAFVFNIPILAKAFETYVHQTSTSESVSLSNSFSFDRMDLQFTDEKGNLLDFHGVPWSLLLQFDIDYALDTNWQQLEWQMLDSYPKDFP